jgi:hypothetical protein
LHFQGQTQGRSFHRDWPYCFSQAGRTMKTFIYVIVSLLLLILASGCGGDREKGMNSPNQRKDLPRVAPTEKNK